MIRIGTFSPKDCFVRAWKCEVDKHRIITVAEFKQGNNTGFGIKHESHLSVNPPALYLSEESCVALIDCLITALENKGNP